VKRSIRCKHGMDRSLVACPACGDDDADSRAQARANGHVYTRPQVVNKSRAAMPRRERLAYARRERQAGR
jgi:predicted RNA-binding Zn-ribbon protein involved in translation (DUF1610 family)